FGLRALARELLDLMPPTDTEGGRGSQRVAGWALKAVIAYGGTRALGEAARRGVARAPTQQPGGGAAGWPPARASAAANGPPPTARSRGSGSPTGSGSSRGTRTTHLLLRSVRALRPHVSPPPFTSRS